MVEYISREAVLSAIWKTSAEHNVFFPAIMLGAIKSIPAADVRPVARGRWNNIIQGIIPSGQCSNCGAWDRITPFCPYCGADMREET